MGLHFLDTSALVKLYVQEPGTDWLLQLVTSASDDRFAVLSLSVVEARSAIRRRQKAGDINQDAAVIILDARQKHLESKFIRQTITNALIDIALEMVDRYALRAYDTVQLGGCLVLGATERRVVTFVCSDRQLLIAARAEKIAVLDPTA